MFIKGINRTVKGWKATIYMENEKEEIRKETLPWNICEGKTLLECIENIQKEVKKLEEYYEEKKYYSREEIKKMIRHAKIF